MAISEVPDGSIAVGVDDSLHSDRALDWAADIAAAEHRTLAVVHSESPMGPLYGVSSGMLATDWPDLLASSRRAHAQVVARAVARARHRRPALDVRDVVDEVDPRVHLVTDSEHAHLMVLGTRGRGPVASLVLGSVSGTLVRSASCPVVVVRDLPDEADGLERREIVIAVDGTADSLPVLEFGFDLASHVGRPVRVIHLLWTNLTVEAGVRSRVLLAETVAGLGEKFPDVTWTSTVLAGPLADTIVDAMHDAALMVVGRHRTRTLDRLLYRSTATTVLEHAPCPVAVVPVAARGH
ncbi:universal stress protein [Nocardioides rubriscoriae]|uniref:universal stress protein n=1 Tax=Nocardioides rubriscoriae TaxID=642762 RepID=UPI001478E072|nr:universal stress protein [Nocardioides rubriscoriae]